MKKSIIRLFFTLVSDIICNPTTNISFISSGEKSQGDYTSQSFQAYAQAAPPCSSGLRAPCFPSKPQTYLQREYYNPSLCVSGSGVNLPLCDPDSHSLF